MIRNAGTIHYALFWNGNTCVFWISYIQWHKFYNHNLRVVLESKQGGTLNSWTPNTRTERQFNCWLSQSEISCLFFRDVKLFFNENKQKKSRRKQAKNEKQTFFERLYWVVFQVFIQKYYILQNNTLWCGIISTKKHDACGLRWTKY